MFGAPRWKNWLDRCRLSLFFIAPFLFCLGEHFRFKSSASLCFALSVMGFAAWGHRIKPTESQLSILGSALWFSTAYFYRAWFNGWLYGISFVAIKTILVGLLLVKFRSPLVLIAVCATIKIHELSPQVLFQLIAVGMLWMDHLARRPVAGQNSQYTPTAFPQLILVASAMYVIHAYVLNPEAHWVHPEVSEIYFGSIVKFKDSGWGQFKEVFNLNNFDFVLWSRPRFLSNLFMILDVKLRLAVPEVSRVWGAFSLTFLLSILLTPVLLFSYLTRIWGRAGAFCGTALFLTCAGTLSHATFRFHPGKPLTALALILLLCVAQRLERLISVNAVASRVERALFAFLLGLQFLCFFLDEMAFFSVFVIPLLHPKILGSSRKVYRLWWALPGLAFLATVTWIAPAICRAFNYPAFDFWGLAVRGNPGLGFHRIESSIYVTFLKLMKYYSGYSLLGVYEGPYQKAIHGLAHVLYIGLLAMMILLFHRRTDRAQKAVLLRSGIAAAGFIVFYCVILSRLSHTFGPDYYYGSPFSLFYVLMLTGLFSSANLGYRRMESVVLMFLIGVNVLSFGPTSERWSAYRVSREESAFDIGVKNVDLKGPPSSTNRIPVDSWLFHEINYSLRRR